MRVKATYLLRTFEFGQATKNANCRSMQARQYFHRINLSLIAKGPMNISGNTVFKIALLPGDGIGPEVIDSALVILRSIESQLSDVRFDFEQFSVGAQEFLTSEDPLPASSFDRLGEFRAILLGAMGLPGVRWPSGIEMTPQLDIRERLDLYCGLRPIYLFSSGFASPQHGARGHRFSIGKGKHRRAVFVS